MTVKIGATYGHHPERETWSEAHDRLMQDEHLERLRGAVTPKLDGTPRRNLRPVWWALGAFGVVALLLMLIARFGWVAVVLWAVGTTLCTWAIGAVAVKWDDEEIHGATDERPFVEGRE